MKGIETQTPELPSPYSPSYEEWKRVFEQFSINAESLLVGHSCGAGFLLRWLGESKAKIHRLFLVAPYLDPHRKKNGFLDFKLDANISHHVSEIHLLYSTDEPVRGVSESVESVLKIFPSAKIHRFENMGHFTLAGMGSGQFPFLLELMTTHPS
jgi:predicted alpha/beta hydrolase family esterase